jgi:hypothetical protein
MIEVNIPFHRIPAYKDNNSMKLYHASNYAILIADWCKDQGLIMGKDFDWSVWSDDTKITFRFFDSAEKWSTIFALKFGDGGA